jgi:ABC-2 type transport system ATP-binding protein
MPERIIDIRGLKKSFSSGRGRKKRVVEAVTGVDLAVQAGEIFGFLGPNGAGKTTTLRMIVTLLPPDDGTVTIAGCDLRTDAGQVRRRVGYVPQGGCTWHDVSGREELVLHARMHGIRKVEAEQRAEDALAAFGLTDFADRPCKTYSGGQRRRVDIAMGVIHRPQVLFLDEPTTGLDPQGRAQVWSEVRRLNRAGMTVFITTHYMDEADALCDRIAIMDQGRIVAEDTPDRLKREVTRDVVTVSLDGAAPKAAELLGSQPYVQNLEITEQEGLVRLHVDDGTVAIPLILRVLDSARLELGSIQLQRPTLDDVFLAKTGRTLLGK